MIAGLVFLLIESLLSDRIRKRKQKRSKQETTMPENLSEAQDA